METGSREVQTFNWDQRRCSENSDKPFTKSIADIQPKLPLINLVKPLQTHENAYLF